MIRHRPFNGPNTSLGFATAPPSSYSSLGEEIVYERGAALFVIDEDTQEYVSKLGAANIMQRGSTTGSDTNDPAVEGGRSHKWIYFPGTVGNYIRVPDEAALNITGDIDIRVRMRSDNWASDGAVANKNATSYAFYYKLGTRPRFYRSGSFVEATATYASVLTDGEWYWLRATRDSSTGEHNFYYAADSDTEPSTWTQLGATVTGAIGSFATNTDPLTFGGNQSGSFPFAGGIAYAAVHTTIGGSSPVLEINVDTDNSSNDQSSFTASTGQTVTIGRTTSGLRAMALAENQYASQFDGSDDYFELPANCTPTFTATTGGYTVLLVMRRFGTGTTGSLFSSESANVNGLRQELLVGTRIRSYIGGASAFVDDNFVTPMADGEFVVLGTRCDSGFVEVWDSSNAGYTGSPSDYTSVGAITHQQPRVGVRAYVTAGAAAFDLAAIVVFQEGLSDSETQAVSDYLETLL